MQDEIVKHTKKAYDEMRNREHSFWHKTKEVLVEIGIIVFAVTLSIWLHSWSEERQQQREVRDFLADLKEDLSNDISSIESAKAALVKSRDTVVFLYGLTKGKIDSLVKTNAAFGFQSSIGTTKINSGNYEGFKSSGKIGFIENKELKKYILNYYQDATPSIAEAEKINASLVLKISDFWTDNAELDIQKIVLSPRLKNILVMFLNTSKSTLDLYQDAVNTAKKIIVNIDKKGG